MRRALFHPILLAFAFLALQVSTAYSQFEDLAKRVPSSANALTFVNVEKLLASPVAVKGKWAERRDTAFASGVSFLPPDTKQAILAMDVDLQTWVPLWEAALMELNHSPSIEKIVEMTGGTSDLIAGRRAVALPEDAYVIQFDKTSAALMAPANRQTVARWMRDLDARKGLSLSPYLSEAYHFANEHGTPVIMALDLEDAITIDAIRDRLENSKEALAKLNLEVEPMAKMLSGIRGLTLGITFGDKPFGKIKVDFNENISISPEAAKGVLLHALGNHGAMIDEFADWKPAVKDKQVTLEGNLEASGLRRLSSLFDRPPSLKEHEPAKTSTPQTKEQKVLVASQNYFKRVTDLLDDLKQEQRGNPNYTMGQIGVWMNKYATKIDQLSVLNVDPELVDYGANVSDSLRAAYNQIRTGAARARTREVNTQMQYNYYSYGETYGYTYRDGYYGGGVMPWGSYGTVAVPDQQAYNHERTRARTEERIAAGSSARDIMGTINSSTGTIRRKMSQKYQADF